MINACKVFIVSLFAVFTFASPAAALSVPAQLQQFAVCNNGSYAYLGLEPWFACVTDPSGRVVIDNLNDIWLIVLVIIEDAIKIGGYIAVGFVIWGGIKYIKSNGAPDQAQQARDVIRNALIGLVITLLSVAIVEFIVARVVV